MKKLTALLLALCLLLSCAWAEETAEEERRDVVVLFTNDVHCGISQNWGYAGLYAVREYYARNHHNSDVLLADCGDAIQGEASGLLTGGEAIVEIMNTMRYDVAIPGNHEFDYGTEHFIGLTEKAEFPYVCCNFTKEGQAVFPPYVILEAGGVRIGFVGVVTPTTLRSGAPSLFRNEAGEFIYGFMGGNDGQELYETVQKAVDGARADGADYVVLLAHLGNQAEDGPYMYANVIENTSGIDVMLDAHSHDTELTAVKNREGKDVLRASTGTKLEHIGVLTVTKDGEISAELLDWNQKAGAQELLGLENAAADAVSGVRAEMNESLEETVAELPFDLVIDDPDAFTDDGWPVRLVRRAETNLADLVADAFLQQSDGADFALVNGGAVRDTLHAGTVTMDDIISLQPYTNFLQVAELKGRQVLDALEWGVHEMPGEFAGFLQVSGLTYEVDERIPTPVVMDENSCFDHVDGAMERRVRNVRVNGEPLDPEKTYRVAIADYVVNGGDGFTMFGRAGETARSGKLTYAAVADYLRDTLGGTVGSDYENIYGQGRIVSVHAEE